MRIRDADLGITLRTELGRHLEPPGKQPPLEQVLKHRGHVRLGAHAEIWYAHHGIGDLPRRSASIAEIENVPLHACERNDPDTRRIHVLRIGPHTGPHPRREPPLQARQRVEALNQRIDTPAFEVHLTILDQGNARL
jgi:hypothetical protein